MERRHVLRLLVAAPLAGGCAGTILDAARRVASTPAPFTPGFFTPHEYQTVRALVDLIIPRDGRSGSATDAGVAEFIDFVMLDQPARQTAMRGGLAWLDRECHKRFGQPFFDCAEGQRTAVLDDIAWPDRAAPEISHGVAFFNTVRDLTATGFWTSQMGIEDLGYMGNRPAPEWKGCPGAALSRASRDDHFAACWISSSRLSPTRARPRPDRAVVLTRRFTAAAARCRRPA